ncbi:hypothetical protein [Cryobacterium sp.]|jgi:hypothetical protein|uniref:hypothetical protein n=1 Tax=Cryobacterium sp. TaxID=1926290 RepID=UPI002622D5C1|nr:hypothetical protein [Cryobacterium sp.]MCU1447448.1 hypothetical protein [Cryobacterium sp.]
MTRNGDTQDEPIQDQHSQPDDAKVAGILVQQEADLAGHDEAQVLEALRQRFADAHLSLTEDALRGHAKRIAGLEPNDFSRK